MLKILATYNIKGGVGKTAAAVNLAYLAAREGSRTLIWDLDPQGSASFYFRIKPRIKAKLKAITRGKRELIQLAKGTDYENLDLIPADFSYRNMDLALNAAKKPAWRLLKLLRPLAEEYDYVFLDCAPSISLVSESVFRAADALLVPLIPTTLSVRTFNQILRFVERNRLQYLELMPFFTMVDRRKRLHKEIIETLPNRWMGFLPVMIPYASDVERMGVHRAPLGVFAANSPPARIYEALWSAIKQRLI